MSGTLRLTRAPLMRDAPYGGPGTSRTGGPEEVAGACELEAASERGGWGAGVEQDVGCGPTSESKEKEPEQLHSRQLGRLQQAVLPPNCRPGLSEHQRRHRLCPSPQLLVTQC